MKVKITQKSRIFENNKPFLLEVDAVYSGERAEELVRRGRAVEIQVSMPEENRETKIVDPKETKAVKPKKAAKK